MNCCEGITKSGEQCKKKVGSGKNYCHFHTRNEKESVKPSPSKQIKILSFTNLSSQVVQTTSDRGFALDEVRRSQTVNRLGCSASPMIDDHLGCSASPMIDDHLGCSASQVVQTTLDRGFALDKVRRSQTVNRLGCFASQVNPVEDFFMKPPPIKPPFGQIMIFNPPESDPTEDPIKSVENFFLDEFSKSFKLESDESSDKIYFSFRYNKNGIKNVIDIKLTQERLKWSFNKFLNFIASGMNYERAEISNMNPIYDEYPDSDKMIVKETVMNYTVDDFLNCFMIETGFKEASYWEYFSDGSPIILKFSP